MLLLSALSAVYQAPMRAWLWWGALCLSLMASDVRAEEPVPEAYSRTIAEALAEYETGNFSEARVLFEEAHAIYPNARTLRGLGITAIELRMYVEAETTLREALTSTVRPLSAAQRVEVEKLIERAGRNIATVKVTLTPPEAQLQIGDARVTPSANGELRLNPGDYLLTASAPGYATQKHVLHAVGGQTRTMLVSLERDGAGPSVTAPSEPKPVPATPPPANTAPGDTTWIWVATGTSVAFATTGVVLHLVARGKADDIEQLCPVEPVRRCSAQRLDQLIDVSKIELLNTLTLVSFIASGAALATGGVLLGLHLQEDDRSVALHVSPLGAALTGSF